MLIFPSSPPPCFNCHDGCNGYFLGHIGIPCNHLRYDRISYNKALEISDFHEYWHVPQGDIYQLCGVSDDDQPTYIGSTSVVPDSMPGQSAVSDGPFVPDIPVARMGASLEEGCDRQEETGLTSSQPSEFECPELEEAVLEGFLDVLD